MYFFKNLMGLMSVSIITLFRRSVTVTVHTDERTQFIVSSLPGRSIHTSNNRGRHALILTNDPLS